MRESPTPSVLHLALPPAEVASRWLPDRPLLWLHSGRMHPRWARWSILATPQAVYQFNGRSRLLGVGCEKLADIRFTDDPLHDLNAVVAATAIRSDSHVRAPWPFRGGWIGVFSYELGGVLEPRASHARSESRAVVDRTWPLIELAWCPDALIFDHLRTTWTAVGGFATACLSELNEPARFELGSLNAACPPEEYERMVARTIEYIAAGDIFQANIAQRFDAPFSGSTRAMAIKAFDHAKPWYGAYLECGIVDRRDDARGDGRAVLSLSPELFLNVNPRARQVVTRPIKGTRPASCEARVLRDSLKDHAELNMIVDLMRNDLGRVCTFGSVRVPQPRSIESHPTVHHGVAEITGQLRDDVRFSDVLRATFPPGSVTGAPKIRAMQIIDELEHGVSGPRGPYCGAIGFISDCGAVTLNVAIRSLLLHGRLESGRCDSLTQAIMTYSAGAGIVADSDPAGELQETFDKATVLRSLESTVHACRPHARSSVGV